MLDLLRLDLQVHCSSDIYRYSIADYQIIFSSIDSITRLQNYITFDILVWFTQCLSSIFITFSTCDISNTQESQCHRLLVPVYLVCLILTKLVLHIKMYGKIYFNLPRCLCSGSFVFESLVMFKKNKYSKLGQHKSQSTVIRS